MATGVRNYGGPDDYRRVSAFLIRHYQPGNADGNWLEPAWEYMHGHPQLDGASLGRIGIWEDEGEIVAVANYESTLGEAFFQFHPGYRHLRGEVLAYAEEHLAETADDLRRRLRVYVPDFDGPLLELVRARGYTRDPENTRPMSQFVIPEPFAAITLPAGYRLTSLEEECDWARVHRALWRGFNNPGEPPAGEDELESRRRMFETATARLDLKIAAVAPPHPGRTAGDFVAFAGTFYEPTGRYCYVEPVATDPDYRRMGLGRAAVLEGVRRCGALGATVAYVGSDQAFYQAIGFRVLYNTECWARTL
ncbi:MAG: GNAT family N-acetyltransferase [Anaerolineae bacterium]